MRICAKTIIMLNCLCWCNHPHLLVTVCVFLGKVGQTIVTLQFLTSLNLWRYVITMGHQNVSAWKKGSKEFEQLWKVQKSFNTAPTSSPYWNKHDLIYEILQWKNINHKIALQWNVTCLHAYPKIKIVMIYIKPHVYNWQCVNLNFWIPWSYWWWWWPTLQPIGKGHHFCG